MAAPVRTTTPSSRTPWLGQSQTSCAAGRGGLPSAPSVSSGAPSRARNPPSAPPATTPNATSRACSTTTDRTSVARAAPSACNRASSKRRWRTETVALMVRPTTASATAARLMSRSAAVTATRRGPWARSSSTWTRLTADPPWPSRTSASTAPASGSATSSHHSSTRSSSNPALASAWVRVVRSISTASRPGTEGRSGTARTITARTSIPPTMSAAESPTSRPTSSRSWAEAMAGASPASARTVATNPASPNPLGRSSPSSRTMSGWPPWPPETAIPTVDPKGSGRVRADHSPPSNVAGVSAPSGPVPRGADSSISKAAPCGMDTAKL